MVTNGRSAALLLPLRGLFRAKTGVRVVCWIGAVWQSVCKQAQIVRSLILVGRNGCASESAEGLKVAGSGKEKVVGRPMAHSKDTPQQKCQVHNPLVYHGGALV